MQPRIRKAVNADYESLCVLFEEADARHREHYPGIFRKPEGAVRTRGFVEGLITDEEHGLFVAEVDERVVGLLHVAIKTPSDFPILVPRRYAVIENVVVAAAFRRLGIGRALMAKAQAWAEAVGADSIELSVWAFNDGAVEFYRFLGYETQSRKMGKGLKRNRR